MERMCSMCGQVKNEEEFKIIKYKNRKPYRNYYCNTCQRLYQREYMRIYRERRKVNE